MVLEVGSTVEDTDRGRSSRTLLELTASLMESAFQTLGEGAILGSMPQYLEEFGRKNASYMSKRFVQCDPDAGAVSAMTGLNVISRVTGTPFTMPKATRQEAVKRLETCEFQTAFADRSDFARAMMCLLHVSVYRGHVNGLLENSAEGYDVELESRILFGDAHCDFHVTSRKPRGDGPDTECEVIHEPDGDERSSLSDHFYTAILVSFIEYLTKVLPTTRVEAMLTACAEEVGTDLAPLLHDPELQSDRNGALSLVRAVLLLGGRELDPARSDNVRVTSCPVGEAIVNTTKRHDDAEQGSLRRAACMLCQKMTETVARAAWPDAELARPTCLTSGDDDCRFQLKTRRTILER